MKHLVKIVLTAIVDDDDLVIDRLTDTDETYRGCPLNLLPRLARAAKAHGDATDACPFCGGRAEAWVEREATPEDVERYTWPAPRGGEGEPTP